ncbi:MAG: cytochrome c peroxidase [Bacteroidota bacterium]
MNGRPFPHLLPTFPGIWFSWVWLLAGLLACERPAEKPHRPSKAERKRHLVDSLAHFSALPKAVDHPTDNPPSAEKIELGKLLFFDPILSENQEVACATCHHPAHGFAESLEISIGVNGTGFGQKRHFQQPNDIPFTKRNSQTILNTAFNGISFFDPANPSEAPMFWDLRANSLEQQALEPIKSLEEMRGRGYDETEIIPEVIRRLQAIPKYRELFVAAFGSEPIRPEQLAKAIACYERTLITNHSRFDRYMRGDEQAISISEKEGFAQFIEAGCGSCHNGPMFSDFQPHVLGVPDHPKLPEIDRGIDSSFAFRTPSLRNLRFTAPYMHNGSLSSLKRVLEFYEDIAGGNMRNPHLQRHQLDPLVKEIDLRVKDMNPIISFLNTLNDENFDRSEPASVPSGLPVGGELGQVVR